MNINLINKNSETRKNITILFFLIISIFLFILIFMDNFVKFPPIVIPEYNLYKYNDNWKFYCQNNKKHVDLPYHSEKPAYAVCKYEKKLPDNYLNGNILGFKSSKQNVKIEIDGKEVLNYNNDKFVTNKATFGSCWIFYKIPSKFLGKEMTITTVSEDKNHSGKMNDIYLLTNAEVLYLILKDHYVTVIYSIIFMTISVMIFYMGIFLMIDRRESNMMYMGIAMIIYTVWMLSTTDILILFTSKAYIITRISYISLNMLVPAFLMWIDGIVKHTYKEFTKYIKYILCIASIIVFFLGFLNIIDLDTYMILIYIMFSIIAVVYSYIYYMEYFKKNNREVLLQGLMFLSMAVAFVIEFISYYFVGDKYLYHFVQFGSFVCIFLIFIHYYRFVIGQKILELETKYLTQLVYIDNMTGGYNRTAFNKDISELVKDFNYFLINFDCNNLKYVNDNFGHLQGDNLIKDTYKVINATFGKYGKVYRVGGDEFICLIKGNANIENIKLDFYKKVEEINKSVEYDFSIALGFVEFIYNENIILDEIIKESDEYMYKDKRSYKKYTSR